jgi:hypothetical protein
MKPDDRSTFACFLFLFVLCAGTDAVLAQQAKVERIGKAVVAGLSPDVASAVEERGYRITSDDGSSAELWVVKELKVATKDAPDALYPGISNGEFVGVINLPKGMADFRGQAIPPGAYTLRYQYVPQDANHMGVSPNPDFLLAIPVASDAAPEVELAFRKLVSLSAKVTGTHPAVIALAPTGEPGQAGFDQKVLVFTAPVKPAGGDQPKKIGIVLKGQASQ